MGASTLEDVVKAWYADCNRHDLDAAVSILDSSFVEYTPIYPAPLRGKETWRHTWEPIFRAFPDLEFRILNLVTKGDIVAVELVGAGTFKNSFELAGRIFRPTGRYIAMKLSEFYRVNSSEGLIAEERAYEDMTEIVRQLTVTSPVGSSL